MKTREEALEKNRKLVELLSEKREDMCGLGTRLVKLMLNKLSKEGDLIAKSYRTILEIEDMNIKAKHNLFHQDFYYWKKECLINDLVNICHECGYTFGKQPSDVRDTKYIIYFELPDCEQISFHCNLTEVKDIEVRDYEKEWDKKINSTLPKLEKAIITKYYDIIVDKINQQKKKEEKKKKQQE